MSNLKSILVAVDFSPCSIAAFRVAARFAECNRASLRAVHAVALPSYVPAPHPLFPFPLPTQADFVADATTAWAVFAAAAPTRTDVKCDIEVGTPREIILQAAARAGADLLVLGSHSVLDAHKGIGPTATSCMQRARMNVLLVRENHAGPFRSVVACLDFTDTSKLALQQAIRVAAQDGAALHVLHVYDDPWYGLGPPAGVKAHMPDFKAQLNRGVEDRVREFCAPFSHELNALKAGFHCLESEWRGGGYGHAIVRFVKEQGCDLAILGTRDRWNIRDMVFGSTAERVVRGAPCSILAVKPDLTA
ncbi:MAG: universal stress protein [Planctomycetes bacterium]|jgi:nucleotide-binding universal stress UspA family protein|nr:universal stress protein [Phycisphaerae bacterium]MBS0186596.1 universal stress protein [Planctomycetota bacterium]